MPSLDGKNDQVQLADVNGDGLTDIVYPSSGALRTRLMQRQSGGFGWGAERLVAIDQASLGSMPTECDHYNVECTREIAGAPTPKTGFLQMADFNGDAASDLLIQVKTTIVTTHYGTPGCPIEPLVPAAGPLAASDDGAWVVLPYTEQTGGGPSQPALAGNCVDTDIRGGLHAFVVKSIASNALGVASYGQVAPLDPEAINLADTNGDGLTDIFYRATSSSAWAYRINNGAGMGAATALPASSYEDSVRIADVNGDGRADVLRVVDAGSYKVYYAMLALPSGGFAAQAPLPGGNAKICEGSGCDQRLKAPLFGDFDGDGVLDFMSIKIGDNADMYVSRAGSRYTPRDTITRFTNGLGAQTDVVYAPLTNAALYRRDSNTRNGADWGRGAPVLDLLAPSYAVARVSSSSPQAGAPTAKATVHYRYAGAKVQAGGRGFLGFREIVTFDPNESGGYVVTGTTYAQNFPYIGMPLSTVKRAAIGQSYVLPACLNGLINDGCFATPGQSFPGVGGSTFSTSIQQWEADTDIGAGTTAPTPGVQAPIHVRTMGTDEILRDPYTGTQTSRVLTTFNYGSYGNVGSTSVDTYTGSSSTPTSTVITSNAYAQDNPGKWRLGRLSASSITFRRPGRADVVRATSFYYEMGGAATGLLSQERVQPGGAIDQDLKKSYLLDDYGNRTQSFTCADPASSCLTSPMLFHPSSPTNIKRYSRVVYDSRGRYPLATYEPFWDGFVRSRRRPK